MSHPTMDPAVVNAKERRPPQARPAPPPSLMPVPLLKTSRNEEGEYAPPIDSGVHVVYKTGDGVLAVIPRPSAERLPVQPAAEGETAFPFSFDVLSALYCWCEKYTATGASPSEFTPTTNFVDFTLLLSNDWDKQFFKDVLCHGKNGTRLLAVLNAAEQFKMEGLLSFCIMALGCNIRGHTGAEALAYFGAEGPETDAEKAEVAKAYPWLAAAIAPKSK